MHRPFLLVLAVGSLAWADVQLNGVFSDHGILQRERPVPVWGTAAPGEAVTVAFAGQTVKTVADAKGRWSVDLAPLTASAEGRDLTVTGDRTAAPVVVHDVLVGEVWLCSGQSNMEWLLSRSTGGEEIIAAANNPLLRLGRIGHNAQKAPLATVPVTWTPVTPASAKWASAVPYLMGAALQRELGVPVGILNNAYGGTRIEGWLSAEVLRSGPWPQDDKVDVAAAMAGYDAHLAEKPVDKWPGNYCGPTMTWNGAVAPIAGFAIRGLAWYQGENNGSPGSGPRYQQLLMALAASYRAAWKQPDLPLVVVQLCTYKKPGGYAEIREAQAAFVAQDAHAALVVTIDQSAADGDVHYPEKREVGARAARAALGLAYGRPAEHQGPRFAKATFADGKATVSFTHLGGGLVAKDGDLRHVEVAGADGKFQPATAVIRGETLVASSPAVPAPTAVRYAYAQFPWPAANLFSTSGLPAEPFRSDR